MSPARDTPGRKDVDDESSAQESTSEAEADGEGSEAGYTIEAILADRIEEGQSRYLIRWEGWDLLAATWEPPEMFDDMEVSLKSWRKTKLDILAGRKPKFDVDKFNRDHARATKEAERMDLTLEEYSKRLSTNAADYFIASIQSPISQTNPEPTAGTPNPLAAGLQAQNHSTEKAHQLSRPSNQAVSGIETPVSQASHEPTAGTPNPLAAGLQAKKHTTEKVHQLSRPPNQTSQRTGVPPRPQITKPPIASFGTGLGIPKGPQRKHDRAPLPHQVPLQKPSDVSARQPASQAIQWKPESNKVLSESSVATSSQIDAGIQTTTDPFPGPEPQPQSDLETTVQSRTDGLTTPFVSHGGPFSFEPSPPPDEIRSSMLATEDVPSHLRDPREPGQQPRLLSEERHHSLTRSSRRSYSPLFVSPYSDKRPEKRQRVDPTRRDDIHSINHDAVHADSFGPSESDRRGDIQRSIERRPGNDQDRRLPLPPSTPKAPLADTVPPSGSAPVRAKAQSAPKEIIPAHVKSQAAAIKQKLPMPHARYFGEYFENPRDVLVQIFFGHDRQHIGFARVCGAGIESINRLRAGARTPEEPPEMWFRDICTDREYDLIDERLRTFNWYGNAWLEGFPDSNENILQMEESLVKQRCVALFTSDQFPENTWLVYPRSYQGFKNFTRRSLQIPEDAFLVLGIRTGMKSSIVKEVLSSRTCHSRRVPEITSPLKANSRSLSQPTPVLNRGQSNINAESPARLGAVSGLPDSRPFNRSSEPKPSESDSYSVSCGARRVSMSSPRAARRLSNPALSSQVLAPYSQSSKTVTRDTVWSQPMGVPSPMGATLGSLELPTRNDVTTTLAGETPKIIESIKNLTDRLIGDQIDASQLAFQLATRVHEMVTCIKKHSIVPSNDGITNQVDFFYLHYPQDEKAKIELQLVELVLKVSSETRIFSNQDPRGWSKFNDSCKNGAVIFHEIFQDYGSLTPPIRKSVQQGFYFWSVNILEPLRYLHISDPGPTDFVQNLFPTGAAILLTEETFFQNLPQAVRLMLWFHSQCKNSSDPLKLILWPNAIEALEASLDNPARNKDFDRHILLILTFIRKLNSTDSGIDFEEESLNILEMDQPGHNVFYLPVVNYGLRNAHTHDAVPHGLTEAELKADHLVEAFAGWMQHHAGQFRRSYVIANLQNSQLITRWRKWGHLIVTDIDTFLKSKAVKHNTFDTWLYGKGQVNKGERQEEDGTPAFHPNTPGEIFTTPKTPAESKSPAGSQQPGGHSRDPRIANRRPSTSQPSFGYR